MLGFSMTMATVTAMLGAIFVTSLLLTGGVRRYARRALLDLPNERSSHSRPTPRGGGLAIVASFLMGMLVLNWMAVAPPALVWALIGGGALVAGIGWLDDHRHVSPMWRIAVHVAAAAWALYCLRGLPQLQVGTATLSLGWVGTALALLTVVWLTNLYNFMDGIDGLAAGEAVTVALAAAGLLWWSGATGLAMVAALLAVACGGFLWWNWPPAKIFMGDVGSGFLGYCFAVLMLASEKTDALPLAAWLILLAVFVSDASYTLASRIMRGERWYTAHRSHAYQRLIQLGHSHFRVMSAVMLVNLLVLVPIAWWVMYRPVWTWVALPGIALIGWFVWRVIQQRFGKTSPS